MVIMNPLPSLYVPMGYSLVLKERVGYRSLSNGREGGVDRTQNNQRGKNETKQRGEERNKKEK